MLGLLDPLAALDFDVAANFALMGAEKKANLKQGDGEGDEDWRPLDDGEPRTHTRRYSQWVDLSEGPGALIQLLSTQPGA